MDYAKNAQMASESTVTKQQNMEVVMLEMAQKKAIKFTTARNLQYEKRLVH